MPPRITAALLATALCLSSLAVPAAPAEPDEKPKDDPAAAFADPLLAATDAIMGGVLRVGCPVHRVESGPPYRVHTRRGVFEAAQVVSAVPAALTARLGPPAVAAFLRPYLRRDADARGGACVVFLGVPEVEVAGRPFTHHQLMHDYDAPLGDGNNMFISVSAPGDVESAPPGFRAVMISTHCELGEWQRLNSVEYERRKAEMVGRLIALARRVYPELGRRAVVREAATPRTFERFTRRPGGAVGGVRQNLGNSNQHALPYRLGRGFWQVGDTAWPGLGTVACVLGSRLAAEGILAGAGRRRVPSCEADYGGGAKGGASVRDQVSSACPP